MIGRFIDFITFPLRALFIFEESKFGLSSLRDERMSAILAVCEGKVLDIGCGPHNLFINKYIGQKNGVGIDIYPYEGVEHVVKDMTQLPFDDNSFDTVTLIAVGGHIPKSKRVEEFREFSRVLKLGGRLVMTEGEPVTQWLMHKWSELLYKLLNKKDMDIERGMDEEEEYCMPFSEIITYLNTTPLRLLKRKRFMWGLNNIYIAEKY